MPLADALACIDRLVVPTAPGRLTARQRARIHARGRRRRRRALTRRSPIALRDGFALRAEATLDASSYAPRRSRSPPFPSRSAIRCRPRPTRSPRLDAVELRGGSLHALAPIAPGDGVLPPGGDAAAGELLCRAGARLRASDLDVARAARGRRGRGAPADRLDRLGACPPGRYRRYRRGDRRDADRRRRSRRRSSHRACPERRGPRGRARRRSGRHRDRRQRQPAARPQRARPRAARSRRVPRRRADAGRDGGVRHAQRSGRCWSCRRGSMRRSRCGSRSAVA